MAAVLAVAPAARAGDPSEAIDELRVGYSLKQANKCEDALPHLARSFELQPTARAALNLSDCEQRLGDLVAAQTHAAQGADLARQQKDDELAGVAGEQLKTIEQRVPRLTVKLAGEAPGCAVTRDGTALPSPSLGTALAINPGRHVLAVACPGHAEGRFDVTLAEGDRTETVVSPGPAIGAAADAPEPPPSAPEPAPPPERAASRGPNVPPLVVMGAGVAGLAVGLVAGLAADGKHASLLQNCSPQGACPVSDRGDLDAFHALRAVSTVSYVAGAVALAAGAAWWLIAPSARPSAAAAGVWIGPGFAGGRF